MIRDARPADDARRIAEIYAPYIERDTATFETEPVSVDDMWARIARVQDLGLPYLVMEQDDAVIGYAYASPFRDRAAYRHTLETTIYLDPSQRAHGLGTELYVALLDRLRTLSTGPHRPVHTAMAVIALPHPASVALHERLGFRHVGTIREAGFKFGRWIDVGYWQFIF